MVLMIPLLFDLSGKKVLIFGGGRVGERKARLFSRYGDVEVVSRGFTPYLEEMADRGEIRLRRADLADDTIDLHRLMRDAFIVIPATDNETINSRIIEVAERSGVLVNRTDDIPGDVIVPSIIKRGDITVSISTGGISPAMSKLLRERLENEITELDAKMVRLQQRLRGILKKSIPDQRERESILWRVLRDREIWDLLSEDEEKALKLALEKIR